MRVGASVTCKGGWRYSTPKGHLRGENAYVRLTKAFRCNPGNTLFRPRVTVAAELSAPLDHGVTPEVRGSNPGTRKKARVAPEVPSPKLMNARNVGKKASR